MLKPTEISSLESKSRENTNGQLTQISTDGHGEAKLLNGAAMALQSERYESSFPKTVIVKKTVEDHKSVA